ncbi:SGNH/GDSL hydrolase family protein [Aureliella helgolandensis]|nr:SGNH/GDSL hydrolase family protein [Aureliella helgolandensis]
MFLIFWITTTAVLAGAPVQPGDRIAIVGNTFADQLRIHGYLETLLLQYTADKPVSIRNLGWGGDMLTARDRPTNFPSEEETLTAHRTDVIIACFGLGESFAGEERIAAFKSDLQAFIASHAGKKYNGKSEVRLVLVSPIAYEDLGDITPAKEKRNRELAAYTRAMGEVASDAHVPFVDLYTPSLYLMNDPTGPNLTTNGIHLNRYGYWAMGKSFFDQLTVSNQMHGHEPWRLAIDAEAATASARGVKISEVETSDTAVIFMVTETSTPSLPPPTDQPLPPQMQFNRDTLRVERLKPGMYQLAVDDQRVASATAEVWAAGVPIDSSPAHHAAEKLRAAINDKNLQFTYSWKALNQVHIVGERRTSPSGKELPREVIESSELANQRDSTLHRAIELKARRWRISRIEK